MLLTDIYIRLLQAESKTCPRDSIVGEAVGANVTGPVNLVCRLAVGLEAALVGALCIRQVVYCAIHGVVLVGNHEALLRIQLGKQQRGKHHRYAQRNKPKHSFSHISKYIFDSLCKFNNIL